MSREALLPTGPGTGAFCPVVETSTHGQCWGFRAWTAPALQSLPFENAEASGYGFQVEMAMRAVDQGLTIVEVPIVFRDRARGHSKMGSDIVLEAMRLVTLWGIRRRTAWLRLRA